MEKRQEQPERVVTMANATDEERREARELFRRRRDEVLARRTPESRARALALFGLDESTA